MSHVDVGDLEQWDIQKRSHQQGIKQAVVYPLISNNLACYSLSTFTANFDLLFSRYVSRHLCRRISIDGRIHQELPRPRLLRYACWQAHQCHGRLHVGSGFHRGSRK